jgi:hypothetical protein
MEFTDYWRIFSVPNPPESHVVSVNSPSTGRIFEGNQFCHLHWTSRPVEHFQMDNHPNLDFLSPDESDRYIKEQLEETDKQSITETRRANSTFTKDCQQKYAEAEKMCEN